MKTQLNCSLIRKTGEIRAQNSRFSPVTTGTHTKTHYSIEEQPEYKGRGRPPNPKKVPPPDLKYVQVVKHREGG